MLTFRERALLWGLAWTLMVGAACAVVWERRTADPPWAGCTTDLDCCTKAGDCVWEDAPNGQRRLAEPY